MTFYCDISKFYIRKLVINSKYDLIKCYVLVVIY